MLKPESKHIVWLCSGLNQPGGTERANLNAAHLQLEHGFRVTIIVMDETAQSFYPVDPSILVIHKKWFFGITEKGNAVSRKITMLNEFSGLKKLVTGLDPFAIIATDYPFAVACVFTGLHKKYRVFSWEHHHFQWLKKNSFWKMMINHAYPKLRSVLVYNPDEQPWFEKMGCRTGVMPNFITAMPLVERRPGNSILSVGWLIKRKGMDLVPSMAQKILAHHPSWKWIIIGEGELEHDLQKEIAARGLEHKLILQKPKGPLQAQFYQQASIYVMTSRQEPFGLVLIEAMSNGLPCIAFDCPTGPRHIITNAEDGILVPPFDTNAMENAILQMISDEEGRSRMGEKALTHVKKFSAENVWLKWKALLDD